MIDGCEIWLDEPMGARAKRFMQAMAKEAPVNATVSQRYTGKRRLLMVYGPGAIRRMPVIAKHVERGGRVAMWDLGYWDRENSMRLAIDSMHPTAAQLAMAPAGESRAKFDLREDADPSGPILLVGIGAKSVAAYRLGHSLKWEGEQVKRLRKRFPDRQIAWRPKGSKAVRFPGTSLRHGMPIEAALQGCSLVVCRHSNVAVDAAIAGVPVECQDGAALALYAEGSNPSRDRRAEFLRQLSWWNWSISEAREAWDWIRKVTT